MTLVETRGRADPDSAIQPVAGFVGKLIVALCKTISRRHFMIITARHIFNPVDRLFDRAAIFEDLHLARDGGGVMLHRQLYGLWQQERRRRPDRPMHFLDSDAALSEFTRQGLDITRDEFSLSTGQSPEGCICWIAQARQKVYYAPFTQ